MVLPLLRRPLAKKLTRLITYGLGLLLAGSAGADLANTNPEAAKAAELAGEAMAGVLLIAAGAAMDRLHHRLDTARQEAPVPGQAAATGTNAAPKPPEPDAGDGGPVA
jgi:dihydrodipicolinate synthase/N-acetylneuraminate lyase